MPRPSEAQKQAVMAAITEHLGIHGANDWDQVRKNFPDVSRATFFRWVKEVRDSIEEAAVERGGIVGLKIAQQRIKRRVETQDETQKKLKATLPAAPSPAVIATLGPHAETGFDLMAYFHVLLQDVDLLRNTAIAKNEDGSDRVKNPLILDKTIQRRIGLIESYLHTMSEMYNLNKIQELYNLIIEEVGKADPDVQRAIVTRLRTLNNQRGLTVNAVLG